VSKFILVKKLSKLGFKRFEFMRLGLREGPTTFVLCRK